MKSIFILGASRLQLPAIKKAKEKGLFVYVLDYDPEAVGIKYADRFLEISTIDKEAVYILHVLLSIMKDVVYQFLLSCLSHR